VTRPDPAGVSVVVITRDRRGDLRRALGDLTALPERPPVIVIDNGSTDGTSAMVRAEFPGVRLHRLEENRGASSRNIGVREAATPYVAFCDDDMSWEPGSLARAAELLDRHERLALITARILVGAERKLDPVCVDMATSPLAIDPGLPGYPVISFMAGGTIVRREAFLAVGGFERRFQVGGEERLMAVDLMARGWAMAYVPELVALHRPSPSRDPGSRARIQIRNHLWFTWLRRPVARALSETWRIARQAGRQEAARRALIEAGRELGWVLRHRATLPADVESRLLAVERATDASRYL
jgi:GT2 family glycosyltransferase